jgi:hypothetical protein
MNQRPLVPTAAIVLAAVEAAYEVVASEELVPDGVLVTRPRRAGGGDTESSSWGMRSSSVRISVPLPTRRGR